MTPHPLSPAPGPQRPQHSQDAAQRRDRLLDKARRLRRAARTPDELWLAEQYETAAAFVRSA